MLKNTIVLVIVSLFLLICWVVDLLLEKIVGNEKINFKTLGLEFLKFIIILIVTVILCFTIELIPFLFEKIDIDISTDLIAPIEIISIIFTLYKSYMVSIFNKIKQLLTKKE